jgi:hypothetical protein
MVAKTKVRAKTKRESTLRSQVHAERSNAWSSCCRIRGRASLEPSSDSIRDGDGTLIAISVIMENVSC